MVAVVIAKKYLPRFLLRFSEIVGIKNIGEGAKLDSGRRKPLVAAAVGCILRLQILASEQQRKKTKYTVHGYFFGYGLMDACVRDRSETTRRGRPMCLPLA